MLTLDRAASPPYYSRADGGPSFRGSQYNKIKRWAVVEPIIGHAKKDGLLGRNWLKGRTGDRSNALLAAAGFNLRQLLRFLNRVSYFLRAFFSALLAALHPLSPLPA